jgi:transcriptional regulator with XRE-family HTH domain
MNFSEKLLHLRKQRGWSQEQLAEQLCVSRQAVSKWESGSSLPDVEKLIALSALFDLSLDELLLDKPSEAAMPARRPFSYHYEYRSHAMLFGLPWVHIHVGRGGHYRARGILAIGNIAQGVVALGGVAMGGLTLGGLSLGLIALGGLAAGLAALGGLALGLLAVGGLALGLLAMGGVAIGICALGGCAIASQVAIGGYAHAPIALGDVTLGVHTFTIQQGRLLGITPEALETLILEQCPGFFPGLAHWLTQFFH